MVDLNTCPPTPPLSPGVLGLKSSAGNGNGNANGNGGSFDRSKLKSFMGRTPGIGMLKSKFLTVLGNSNELLNGISNKLTLSISSSESEFCDNDDEEELPKFDESIDYTKIDFESRRVKARRAHEEIISGRFRHPNLAPKPRLEAKTRNGTLVRSRSLSSSSSSTSSSSNSSHSFPTNAAERSHVSSTTRSNSIESRHSGGYGRPGRAIPGARRSDLDVQRDLGGRFGPGNPHIDVQPPPAGITQETEHWPAPRMEASASMNSMRVPGRSRTSNSSTLTSLRDDPEMQGSPSVESTTDWRNFIRSESQNSVPSWASSISLDCRAGEEPVKEFMKHFIDLLFNNVPAIGMELKSEFGAMVRLDIGRQWFTRLLLEQKQKSKRVEELTFHSLVQYFAIVLFECGESEDYGPATVIMSLCFMFYHEIEVPGCEAYREYLFTFMRQQPLWHTLRFWNAAFFDAVQNEREHRMLARLKRAEKRQKRRADREKSEKRQETVEEETKQELETVEEPTAIDEDNHNSDSSSSSSSVHHDKVVESSAHGSKEESHRPDTSAEAIDREQLSEIRMQENIVFRQLSAFTCNMHSLGISQELCVEFMKKQALSQNLSNDKAKLVRDNITRMYRETELWGSKQAT